MKTPAIHEPEAEIISPRDCVRVLVRRSPFVERAETIELPSGMSVAEILETLWRDHDLSPRGLHVHVDGAAIPREFWERIRIKPGRTMSVVRVPLGKAARQVLLAVVAVVALVVTTVVAPWLSAALTPALGAFWAGVAGATAAGVIGLGISLGGQMAINALFPVAKPNSGLSSISQASFDPTTGLSSSSDTTKSPSYAIGGGRNESRPYGVIPEVLGRHRMSPAYGARPFTEVVGDDQYLTQLFVWGYGPLEVTDVRIGETPISAFEAVAFQTFEDHLHPSASSLFPTTVFEEPLSIELTGEIANWQQRTTADNVDTVHVDIVFPGGLYLVTKDTGETQTRTVNLLVQYAVAGTGVWQTTSGFSITSDKKSAVRRTLIIYPGARGQYDVRMISATPAYSGPDFVQESVTWSAIRGVRNENPVKYPRSLTISTVRIKASSQLNGTIDQLNGVVRRKIKAWNGTAWVNSQFSSNPADMFRHVLQSSANERPVPDSEIDLVALQGWHAYCVAGGYTFNQIRDFVRSAEDTLRDIATAGRAAISLIDGKWSVIWDRADLPVVQHFTPRNSSNFESVMSYVDMPHAFRVRFVNEDNNWLQDERVVYDDGYDVSNATEFEGLEFPGITKPSLIWKFARYHIAQLRLRRATYSIQTDWEHLVCNRGDLVLVQHDVPIWGLGAARVRSVDAGAQTVTLDDFMPMEAGKRYTLRARLADGSSLVREVVANPGEHKVLSLVGSGDLPEDGDMIMFGLIGADSRRMRVHSKEPLPDLQARLYLVDEAPAIQTADQGTIPPFVSGTPAPLDFWMLPPRDLIAVEALTSSSISVQSDLEVSWTRPAAGLPATNVLEWRRKGDEWGNTTFISGSDTETTIEDLSPGVYDVRVRAIFIGGQVSDWRVKDNIAVNLLVTPPETVENFSVSAIGDVATLSWSPASNAAVSHYRIKFAPVQSGAGWSTSAVLADRVTGTLFQTATQAGTWLIKAVSFGGVESNDAALITSNVAALTNFNSVEVIEEHPAFAGAKSAGVWKDETGALRLVSTDDVFALDDFFAPGDFFFGQTGIVPSGIYYFTETVDLGDVYTTRLSASIVASGVSTTTDVFALADFFAPADFFGVNASQWDVTVEQRTTLNDPSGSPTWSPWSPLVIGDVTARGFQFRAVLSSTQANITPVVTALSVTIDMPDRIVAENDLTVTTSGRSIVFAPAFRRLQGLGIAAENMATGDYYTLSAKSETGFTIQFFNSSNTAISRRFDYVAKGYGAVT